jgi:hypothetical protein
MIGIPTFGADGGKSGISTYLIALLREWAAQGLALEIFHYPDEAKLFLPEGNRFSSIPVNPFWRKPLANLLWHQAVLPWEARKRKQKVLFLPAEIGGFLSTALAPLWPPFTIWPVCILKINMTPLAPPTSPKFYRHCCAARPIW